MKFINNKNIYIKYYLNILNCILKICIILYLTIVGARRELNFYV